MNEKKHEEPAINMQRTVHFSQRPSVVVTCPLCCTEQRAERDRCYRCGAVFVFISETKQPENKGA